MSRKLCRCALRDVARFRVLRVSATRGTAAVSSTALQSQQITSVAAGSSGSASMNLTFTPLSARLINASPI
jgi:hypothetical protein